MILGGPADSFMTHGSAPACVYTDTDTGIQKHTYTCPHSWGPPHKHLFLRLWSKLFRWYFLGHDFIEIYFHLHLALLFAIMQYARLKKKNVSAHSFI